MIFEKSEQPFEVPLGFRIFGVCFSICFDKWSYQPTPDSSLMISCIALVRRAFIARYIPRIARAKRPQSDRRKQLPLNLTDHGARPINVQHRVRQTYSKDLIRADR